MKERSYEIISYIFFENRIFICFVCFDKTYSSAKNTAEVIEIYYTHRLNMELDLQSLLGSTSRDVHSCSHWLSPAIPSPAFKFIYEGRYWSAKIDDISLKPPYYTSKELILFLEKNFSHKPLYR